MDHYVNLPSIKYDLARILNQPLISRPSREADGIVKRLGGLNFQPGSVKSNQFQKLKTKLQELGANEQTSETLALVIGNVAKLTGQKIEDLLKEISGTRVDFQNETYKVINKSRSPDSQLFKFSRTDNFTSFNRNLPLYYQSSLAFVRITSIPETSALNNGNYDYEITASDSSNVGDLFFVVDAPEWLTLVDNGNGTASLSTNNAQAGSYQIVVQVFNQNGLSDRQEYTLEVMSE